MSDSLILDALLKYDRQKQVYEAIMVAADALDDHAWHNPCKGNCTGSCMWHDGGLETCAVCRSLEGATTTQCPGERMDWNQSDLVYEGKLDFRFGEWVEKPSLHSPAFTSGVFG